MRLFDIDFIDQLSEQQVRYLLRSELERNKLIISRNNFKLFRYEVGEDVMIILCNDAEGKQQHLAFEEFSKVAPNYYFDETEHQKIVEILKRVVVEPDFPRTGTQEYTNKEGADVCTEYTCLYDENGKVTTIVGQYLDVYLTRDRMLETIKMLNEQIAMTDIMRHSYETMIYIDLKDFSFKLLQGTAAVRAASQKVKTVLELGELFCQYYVDAEFQEGFRNFINEITINDRFQTNRFVSYEYLTKNIGWCHARIMPGEMDSKGQYITAIFTTESAADHHKELSVLRVAAMRDALTGIMNRYSGERAINETLSRCEPGIYMLFDCDHFKMINDKLGHPVGDQVLIEVARSLSEVYARDIVMRLGGDEFVVYVTNPDTVALAQSEGVSAILAPLRERLKKINIPLLRTTPCLSCGAIFVSVGMEHDLQNIYEMADKKLYEAKVLHNGSVRSGEI